MFRKNKNKIEHFKAEILQKIRTLSLKIILLVFVKKRVPLTFHDGGRYHIETSPLICGANA